MKALALFFILVSCTRDSTPDVSDCLRYEPAQSTLVGTLIKREYPGPPNWEDVAQGDRPEHPYILVLDLPICVLPDPSSELNSEGVEGVHEVQINAHGMDLSVWLGQHIQAKGHLFAAHTGHHRTPVVLWTVDLGAAQHGA